MISPHITEAERALSDKVVTRARLPVNALGRLKARTGVRYDAQAKSGAVHLVISHCEIVRGMPRYNAKTVYEPVGVYPDFAALLVACDALA
jgi:hypothetical protein